MRPNIDVLRSAIRPMLTEQGKIQRTEGTTTDEDGYEIPNIVTVFDGPVLIRPEGNVQYVSVGEVERPKTAFDVTLPAGSDVVIGDILDVTACAFDSTLEGSSLNIVDVKLDAWQVARYCRAERGG